MGLKLFFRVYRIACHTLKIRASIDLPPVFPLLVNIGLPVGRIHLKRRAFTEIISKIQR